MLSSTMLLLNLILKSRWLFQHPHRVSNNVGSVKHVWGAPIRAVRRAPFRSRGSFCCCCCFCSTNQSSPR